MVGRPSLEGEYYPIFNSQIMLRPEASLIVDSSLVRAEFYHQSDSYIGPAMLLHPFKLKAPNSANIINSAGIFTGRRCAQYLENSHRPITPILCFPLHWCHRPRHKASKTSTTKLRRQDSSPNFAAGTILSLPSSRLDIACHIDIFSVHLPFCMFPSAS